ncbi:MAG: hypothetical protein EOO89_23625 [Pedobacter sp.]|nr:MAG: hypothetical protein EOO89_23625 [Pedobacter sp.]
MNTLELAVPVKGTSFYDLLVGIEEISGRDWKEDPSKDKGRPFPIEKKKYIRSLISSWVKTKHPDREYGAYEEMYEGRMVLMVRRFA